MNPHDDMTREQMEHETMMAHLATFSPLERFELIATLREIRTLPEVSR